MKKLKLYNIDSKYYEHISKFDSRITHSNQHKCTRPYVGILFEIDGITFFAPLTSPKPKHLTMKNSIDFHRIDSGNLGAINFNNMVPIPLVCAKEIDLNIYKSDSTMDKKYKILLQNQIDWCNRNKGSLQHKGETLYMYYVAEKLSNSTRKRCCDFPLLQSICNNWDGD